MPITWAICCDSCHWNVPVRGVKSVHPANSLYVSSLCRYYRKCRGKSLLITRPQNIAHQIQSLWWCYETAWPVRSRSIELKSFSRRQCKKLLKLFCNIIKRKINCTISCDKYFKARVAVRHIYLFLNISISSETNTSTSFNGWYCAEISPYSTFTTVLWWQWLGC